VKGEFTATHHSRLTESQARALVASAQLSALEKESLNPDGTHRHPRLMEQYGYRVNAAKRFSEESETLAPHRVDHYSAVLAANAAGRAELLRLHRNGEIHDTVLHAIEEGLDLEEVNVRRYI
jgi:CPA1 family monovalent cation:H+ antiporter